MYKFKNKSYGVIAVIYYCIFILGLLLSGILYQKGYTHFSYIYDALFVLGVSIVLIKDKNLRSLGFSKEKIKSNLLISSVIVAASFIIVLIFSGLSFYQAFTKLIYYLFYIAAVEEILFRGFIQNYLFGFKLNKYIIFIIGAVFFALIHIPFQMYVHNDVSVHYIITAVPNLIQCFLFHLLMCYITYKRKDIIIPIAFHCAFDYLGLVIQLF